MNWLSDRWDATVGIVITFVATILLPIVVFIHNRVRAGIIQETKDVIDVYVDGAIERSHAYDIRLTSLEAAHRAWADDIIELRNDTKEIRIKADEHAIRLAAMGATLELIHKRLGE